MKLQFDPNDKQREALKLWADNVTEEIVYGGAKNGGKSYLGAGCIFHDALVYPDTMYFIARETLGDLRKYTTPTIHELFSNWGIDIQKYAPYNGQDNFFRCYNKSRVYLIECSYLPSDPLYERFGSMQMTRGWIEEGGEVNDLAKQNLALSVGRWKNDKHNLLRKLLITCNPKKNWIKYNYIDPWKKGELPKDKAYIFASVYDNKHRQSGSEKVLEGLSGTSRQRLLLGDWEYDSDEDCLIASEKIVDLYRNDFVPKGKRYITCDVARFGKDKSVIFVWEGFRVIDVVVLVKKSTTEVADAIKILQSKYQIPTSNVICDEDGVGGGVMDILGCNGFVNNSSPLPNPVTKEKENYDNLKSQCYYLMADRTNKGGIYIQYDIGSIYHDGKSVKELLNQELEQVRQKEVDSDKKKGVLPKEKVKEIIGRSPDISDTMMMREWFEIANTFEAWAL
jgi:phage terminase large subunit